MATETFAEREYSVNPINAVSNRGGSRKDRYIREYRQQRERYTEGLSEAEGQYNYVITNYDRHAAEKSIKYLNQRIRKMDVNIAYI